MKRKMMALVLTAALGVFSLAGCGAGSNAGNGASGDAQTEGVDSTSADGAGTAGADSADGSGAASGAVGVQTYFAELPTGEEVSDICVPKIENLRDDFICGVDISSLLAEEQSGVKY